MSFFHIIFFVSYLFQKLFTLECDMELMLFGFILSGELEELLLCEFGPPTC